MFTRRSINSSTQNFNNLEDISSYSAEVLDCSELVILDISCGQVGFSTRFGETVIRAGQVSCLLTFQSLFIISSAIVVKYWIK